MSAQDGTPVLRLVTHHYIDCSSQGTGCLTADSLWGLWQCVLKSESPQPQEHPTFNLEAALWGQGSGTLQGSSQP